MADISQIKLPNNTTYDLKDSKKTGIYYVKGTQTAATGAWTGNIDVPALYTGLTIMYYLPWAPSGNATLNLTLSDGTKTGAVNCYYHTGRLTTHYTKGSNIVMTYYKAGDISVDGTATTDNRWIANANYADGNSAAYYISNYYNFFVAGSNKIFPYTIVMQNADGRWESLVTSSSTGTSKARNTHGFRLGQMAYLNANATYAENAQVGTNQISYHKTDLIDHRYSFNTANNSTSGTTAKKPIYLVGAINASDGLFYLDATWWTQTLPSTADGKLYIYLGDAYDYYRMSFVMEHPVYWYRNGMIREFAQDAATVNGLTVEKAVPSNAVFTDNDTHRPIKVNGTQLLGNNSTAVNFKNGTNVTISGSGSDISFASETAYLKTEGDNRNVATTPNDYTNKLIFKGLKTNSKIGSPSSDTYSYLVGLRGWSDSSGGNSHELAFNNSGIYMRQGATTSFGDWQKIAKTGDIPTKTSQLTNDSGFVTSDTNNRRAFFGTCSTAAATAKKVVTLSNSNGWELVAGTIIGVKFSITNTASSVTLNVNNTGDKSIYYNNGVYTGNSNGICGYANRTTFYMYDGTYWVFLSQAVVDSNSDANAMYIRYYNNVKAKAAITAEKIIVGDASGYQVAASGITFDISYPIIWTTAAVSSGSSNYANMYSQIYDRTLTNIKSGYASAANKAQYLVVTISGNTATIDSTLITDTLPSTDDGKVYIYLGKLGAQSTGANYFFYEPVHPMFWYKNGSIRPYVNDAATVTGHTVAKDVPSNAVFTDHTYSGTGLISVNSSGVISTTAEVNQNAFSNVKVGSTTVAADTKTDTLELVGSNVTLTPDATNDKVTIGITKANVTTALGESSTWSSVVSALTGDTTVTIPCTALESSSVVDVYTQNSSGTPTALNSVIVTAGVSAAITFDALTENTDFKIHVINV